MKSLLVTYMICPFLAAREINEVFVPQFTVFHSNFVTGTLPLAPFLGNYLKVATLLYNLLSK